MRSALSRMLLCLSLSRRWPYRLAVTHFSRKYATRKFLFDFAFNARLLNAKCQSRQAREGIKRSDTRFISTCLMPFYYRAYLLMIMRMLAG